MCIILRGLGSLKGEILVPCPNPSVAPPKKVFKGLPEAKTWKRYKALAPSASRLKVMGGRDDWEMKEDVFFALLVFIPTSPNSFLKVQS